MILKKIQNFNISYLIFALNLFICFTGFFGIGYMLFPILASIHILLIILKRKIKFQKSVYLICIVLFLFFSIYEITKNEYVIRDVFILSHHIFTPIIVFIYAYIFIFYISENKNKTDVIINILVYTISLLFIYGFLNMLREISIGMPNISNIHSRKICDFWSGDAMAATIQNSYLYFTLFFIPIILFYEKYSYIKKIMLSVIVLVSTIFSFMIGSRTFLVALMLIISISLYYLIKYNIKDIKKHLKYILILLIVIVSFFIIDLFDIRTTIMNSILIQRLVSGSFNIFSDPRIATWIEILGNMSNHFFGGIYELETGLRFAHNMWLDILRTSGVIPFILIIAISIFHIYEIVKLCLVTNYKYKCLLISFNLLLYVLCFLEPVFEGYYYILILFFFNMGLFFANYLISFSDSKIHDILIKISFVTIIVISFIYLI